MRSLYASLVEADGRIYILGEPIDASPAIVGKQLFLRGPKHLYCIEGE